MTQHNNSQREKGKERTSNPPDAAEDGKDEDLLIPPEDDYANLFLTEEDHDAIQQAKERALYGAPPSSPSSPKKRKGYPAYVVFCGRGTGIFRTWAATQAQVSGWPGGSQKGYQSVEEAEDAWRYALVNGTCYPSGFHGPSTNSSGPHLPITPRVPNTLVSSQSATSINTTSRSQTLNSEHASLQPTQVSATNAAQSRPTNSLQPPDPSPALQPSSSILTTQVQGPSHLITISHIVEKMTRLHIDSLQASNAPSARSQNNATAGPSTSHTRTGLPSHRTDLSTFPALDIWWVVTKGRMPGVYHKIPEAIAALGSHPDRILHKAASEAMANQQFVNACMEGTVKKL